MAICNREATSSRRWIIFFVADTQKHIIGQ
jgi:hypothetical protein